MRGRYTIKNTDTLTDDIIKYNCKNKDHSINAINKLGWLEDIEELYYKLLNQEYYFSKSVGGVVYKNEINSGVYFDIEYEQFVVFEYEPEDYLLIRDYGKTWALTIKELE